MSGTPPSLLYLTIYNPTLRPDRSALLDDEDAEEQAQILFYTSRDRAVSRDKMLRQVGLAKALVNFAEIFHSTGSSQSVHSQTRRMITVSPEPSFWMHATIELAKTPRAPTPKAKNTDKGKGKGQQDQVPQLEYHDGSLHDSAVRAHLLRGYEQFKLTHGTFISIFSSLGQQALELQLERFFTVWAWSWDLEKGFNLSTDLGLPLHPSYQLILPLIDNFSSRIPEGMATLVLTQSYVAPSSRYRYSQYPASLARHLMTFVAPERGSITVPPLPSTTKPEQPAATSNTVDDQQLAPQPELPSSASFLGVNISMNMDVRKWNWPSFGKNPSPREPQPVTRAVEESTQPLPSEDSEAQVDQSALEDAITSDNSFNFAAEKEPALEEHEKRIEQTELRIADADTPRPSRVPSPIPDSSEPAPNCSLPTSRVRLEFATKHIFLAPSHDPAATDRRKVYLLKRTDYAVALIDGDDQSDVASLVEPTTSLLEDIEKLLSEDAQRGMTNSLPSVSKILQPKDGHVFRTGDYVNAKLESPLNSDHMFEAKSLLDRDPALVEVFSRGLNPQHWHVVARSSDAIDDGKSEAYLEVSRKEATLSDVDNVLRGLYKTHI